MQALMASSIPVALRVESQEPRGFSGRKRGESCTRRGYKAALWENDGVIGVTPPIPGFSHSEEGAVER